MRLNPCKMFSGKDVRHSFLNFYRGSYVATSTLHAPPIVVFVWLLSVKERKGFIALMFGTRDHPDAFPQSIVKSFLVRCSIVYALL